MRVKSDACGVIRACLLAILLTAFSNGDETPTCQVAVAALNLPAGSDGLLHWRVGDAATVPLQLSTRYFSESLEVPVGLIGFYDAPVPEKMEEPPKPLVALRIPADTKLVFIVLYADQGDDGEEEWQGNLLRGSEWKEGSLRLFNSTTETLGIVSGNKRTQLQGGKSLDYHARDWKEAFPVKIYRLQPEMRPLFSSKWRVAAERRELCFMVKRGDGVALRSLIHLAVPPEEPAG